MGSTDSNIKDALKAQDIRSTPLFHNVQQHYKNIIDPAIGKISNATDLQLSPHGTHVVFTAHVWESIEKSQATRIAEVHLDSGDVRFLSTSSSSHGDAQKPRYSPDGRTVAYTAVNPDTGLSQLCLWDRTAGGDGEGAPTLFPLPGFSLEYALWSADGRSLLCGTAAAGADTSDLFGAVKITGKQDGPAWLPKVEGSQAEHPGRALFVFNVEAKEYRRVSPPGLNVWEANWCGSRSLVGVVSEHGDEGAWYTSRVAIIDLETGQARTVHSPPKRFQAAVPVGSPSGARVAFVQAQCSDRCLVTGDLWTLDVETNATTKHDTDGVDIANATWIDDKTLFVLGIRATQMVAGRLNLKDGRFHEHWAASPGVTTPNYQPDPVSPSPDGSTFPLLLEGWSRIPELILITNGKEKTLFSLNHDGYTYLQSQLGESKLVRWNSSDGLEIEGFIRLPKRGKAPYPLVLHVHGGPVASFRDHWRPNAFDTLLTVNGYAVLSPNPRGSNGRGAEFTSHIFGDMGGKDVDDYLTGIDYLVEQGLVDPKRLGVMGGSYGGYMAAWIITQTDRFAASVAIAPVVDWFSQHTLTNIPTFDQSFMQADPYEIAGPYRTRSPILYAGRYPTPVLLISGEDDPATPPSQARQYHRALVEKGVTSLCLIYPGEGHGVRQYPAYVDYCSRILGWFLAHVPVEDS
ncbi:prolyl oligopeptidase family domain-containing protein [Purpureocillium lilacinum]|uniref:Dipeptidyl-peptidase V n=1 Tax=Purpureocillium lilacinum TaxID=33203 RepID=A0A179H694_PURLI|nr:prolyl oligopeptidase family domain-containing protein [Purpureocillium lilacinum]KAK4093542.1 hypothetical protein Purlil1_1876 [Purpureocillium lilacinum]OAQ77283.1 prolyl oligopeptidase family domain-containing protein [Purpureocillium lilacinum]OAQ85705.1 prolyl oligopeptidase family domain-containing protein [Purpureocillium lilacinum]PWI69817.1 hypothetical protein PCL_00729 [Purpureocillium lilacinum]GJN75456.1 hypothetical protein PLICBS_009555 [Purpureocillium lilacinum]